MNENTPAGPAIDESASPGPAPAESAPSANAGPAPASPTIADEAAQKLDALDEATRANIETAKTRVHTLGHDLHDVAEWLVRTTRGAISDIATAIKHIL